MVLVYSIGRSIVHLGW